MLRTQFTETEGKDTCMFDLKPTYSIELNLELGEEKKKKVFNHEAGNPELSFV